MPLALPPSLTLQPPRARTSPRIVAFFYPRQVTKAFNKPLSFDTSKVTDMVGMFHVRSARALPPHNLQSRRRHPAPSGPHIVPLLARQLSKFNQPLSFDTSRVTNMHAMFYVRSARAISVTLWPQVPRARRLRRRSTHFAGPHLAPQILCLYIPSTFAAGRKPTATTNR